MEFFTSPDWLNRPGPDYAFQLDHIIFIVISMLIGVGLCFLLRKKDKKTIKIVLISLWALAVAIEIFYYGYVYIMCGADPTNHPFNIQSMLPFHSCLMFMYVFPFAIFSKNKITKTSASNFLVIINMIIGFITLFVGCPTKGYSALSFDGIQSMIIHLIIVIVPFCMIMTKLYDLKKGDLKYGLMLFCSLALIMWIFDAFTGCDYFFHYDGHTFGILYEISENVPHIVWTLIVMTCYILTAIIIHYLIVFIKKKINEKEVKKNG